MVYRHTTRHGKESENLTPRVSPTKCACILHYSLFKRAVREAATICPAPCDFDLLTLKVVSESRVTWATSVSILLFLVLSVLDLDPMYATDVVRQTSDSIIA